MRIYDNCSEAIKDIGRELQKCSSEVHTQTMQNKKIAGDSNYNTRELQGFSFAIINPEDKDSMPDLTIEWCKAEFKERISDVAINPGEAWKLREDIWAEFKGEDGKFDYTYSERMHWQIGPVIEEIKLHPATRQAIIQVHNRLTDQEVMGEERLPCSMFYHLMLRNGKLDLIYNMRSTDFATHFQNDIWLALELQKYIAKHTKNEVGKFLMQASSLHIYAKDWELLKRY